MGFSSPTIPRRFRRASECSSATGSTKIDGASCLAGIGFTMSLFVAGLALPNESMVANAKVGILAASLLSESIGSVILSLTLPRKERTQ